MEKEVAHNLRPIRTYDINLIPTYLFEQVERDWSIDKVYALANFINTSPTNMLWAFINDAHEIKGVLWCTINLLNESVFIKVLSIDKEYRGKKVYSPMAHKILNDAGFNKIQWITDRTEGFERLGYKKSKYVLMEV